MKKVLHISKVVVYLHQQTTTDMKTQILEILANGQKLTTNEIADALGTLNRVVYTHLCQLATKRELRRLSPENGSFGVPASWVIFK